MMMSAEHGHGGHGDEWFRHSASDAVQLSHGEFNAFGIAGFLLTVIAIVFSIVVVFVAWVNRAVSAQEAIVQAGATTTLAGPYNESIAKWDGELMGDPVWLDQNTVRLPLDTAAAQVVKMYSAR
ncbi:MAG: hypothetical protein KDA20_11865 [Phycisphaerales bacterium]|nr:hypothetical protein [Phycisphaerales bacterium]